jgi:mono/diheme cytochrome c family protein
VRGFVNGIVFTLALLLGAGFFALQLGVLPSGADVKPPRIERWAARQSLRASISRGSEGITAPIEASDDNLLAGVKSYGQNCAICHGAADAKASTLAKGLYLKAPLLAKDGVEDDPVAVTYWVIKHGIRFTAMPAFGANLSDTELWQITLFLKAMDKLPPAVDAEWKKIPSVAPQS